MTTGADGGKTTSDYLLRGRRPPPPRKRTQNLAEGGAGDEDGHDQQEVVSPTKVVGGSGGWSRQRREGHVETPGADSRPYFACGGRRPSVPSDQGLAAQTDIRRRHSDLGRGEAGWAYAEAGSHQG